jgi:hypothetical protein
LHDYKANHVNYFQKFNNIKVEGYFFFNPTTYNIFQEENLNLKNDQKAKFEKESVNVMNLI